MINLGSLDFHIGTPPILKKELESYSEELFDKWEAYISESLDLPDYSLFLEVENGSVKGKGKIGVALVALYFGIGQYGSFVGGLKTIHSQVKDAAEFLSEKAHDPYRSASSSYRTKKRSESLGALKNLFVKVHKREISVDQAMEKAGRILGNEANSSPEFIAELEKSLNEVPLSPEQLEFPPDLIEDESSKTPTEEPRPRAPTRPRAPQPQEPHNRVEIWRESKNGKRKIRVYQI